MSLLLDALKRAALEKQNKSEGDDDHDTDESVALTGANEDLPLELQTEAISAASDAELTANSDSTADAEADSSWDHELEFEIEDIPEESLLDHVDDWDVEHSDDEEALRKQLEAEIAQEERERAALLQSDGSNQEEQMAAHQLETERIENERIEAERQQLQRLEEERDESLRLESDRIEAERIESEKLEQQRQEAEQLETEHTDSVAKDIEEVDIESGDAESGVSHYQDIETLEAETLETDGSVTGYFETENSEIENSEIENPQTESPEAEDSQADRIQTDNLNAEQSHPEPIPGDPSDEAYDVSDIESTEQAIQEPKDLTVPEATGETDRETETVAESEVETADHIDTTAHEFNHSENSLTLLIHNSHALNRQTKRRSRFLYAMLTLTAFGSIAVYYFYLLSSNNVTTLRTVNDKLPAPVQIQSPAPETAALTGIDNSTLMADSVPPTTAPVSTESAGTETGFTDTGVAETGVAETGVAETGVAENIMVETTSPEAVTPVTTAPEAGAFEPEDALETTASNTGAVAIPDTNTIPVSPRSAYARIVDNTIIASPPRPTIEKQATNKVTNESMAIAQEATSSSERVMIYHEATPTRLSSVVQAGYHAYQAGDFYRASTLYDEALELGPRNRDALLGGAASSTRLGNYQKAMSLYQRRLSDDPSDSYAKTGLIALSQAEVPSLGEISQLLDLSPQAAHLHFLKGAIHAADGDWRSAQSAFFEAHNWDKTNPDYAFNLAVSLDHLSQVAQAKQFYAAAISLNKKHPANFSTEEVIRRLEELEATP